MAKKTNDNRSTFIINMPQPFEKKCPAEEGRKESWSPRYSQKGIVPHRETIASESQELNIAYACNYSGYYKCNNCIDNDSYKLPSKITRK